ncbi:Cob(I)yrinic acid a,c-diamide adenosyltransferase [Pirellula sp. SH-Sr6A]|uniref:cob(I)yrinic acid a,c-diamide adenosyltransferase n=1 Tax=Pirellula sp. SH-Sr6A TaxID=1632865 RepID=UPI00078B4373|nr:cob(I)yrinic acid a,c-diamide adenosyltransferase [Pirellula sp. SH-Sr6A]AMV30772.1 Cob(I)yrinic acid a,c-diamide adenosyltransferase [Pirellula sp. SH-Sr6A]
MKIYTKTGDAGTTGLFGGPRVAKNDARICAYGSIDELNAVLGLARASDLPGDMDRMIVHIQHQLFSIGAELATPNPEEHGLKWPAEDYVTQMEQWIDDLESQLQPLRNFILPGGTIQAAHLHVARTVCRRTEREIVSFSNSGRVSDASHIIVFLNRLSDLLFVMARYSNHVAGIQDTRWESPRK